MMRKIGSKHGAEMTIGTLVIIVLAIIVLVVLAIGFGTGWTNLWQKISAYFGGSDNIDTMVEACKLACSTNAQYAYCTQERNVIASSGVLNDPNDGDTKAEKAKTSCNKLNQLYSSLGFEKCEGISCVIKTCADLGGAWTTTGTASGPIGACTTGKIDLTSQVTDTSDEQGKEYQKCCQN